MQVKLFIGVVCTFLVQPNLYLQNPLGSEHTLTGTVKIAPVNSTDLTFDKTIQSFFSDAPLDVLFATNEDCELFINNEPKGVLSKNKLLYLKLIPGNYSYRAKSKTTGDELVESFVVAENGVNEVFMDLLYTIDQKAAEKRITKSKTSSAEKPTTQVKKSTPAKQVVTNRVTTSAERRQKAMEAIMSNMVLLEPGGFIMGNNKAPTADEIEHTVSISSVYFSKYEVTQDQWESIMGYNPSFNQGCSTCPVENISWEEALIFTRRLNARGFKKFRLPTEAEWEYVSRKGGRAEIENAGGQEAYIKKTAWYFSNSNGKTRPVGEKEPNVLGIYDLTGNVSEWCMDWYGTYYYREDYSQKDPDGPPLGKEKVIRGGNYKDFVGDRFRPSFRNKRNPTEKSSEVGIRLVMEKD